MYRVCVCVFADLANAVQSCAAGLQAGRQTRRQARNLDPSIICLDEGRQRLSRGP